MRVPIGGCQLYVEVRGGGTMSGARTSIALDRGRRVGRIADGA